MAWYEYILPTVKQIQKLARRNKTAEEVLSSRIDAQVTASTDSDADYAAEVADARVDVWGNVQGSLGSNIRGGQERLSDALELALTLLQGQIDALAETRITNTLDIATEAETRRNGLAKEEEARTRDDGSLQRQIDSLSEAVLGILAMISEHRERTGGKS
ncbi:MAG: hypothetical protein IJT02_08350 [Synergistaceae bacterium]|nr:hypothetical protein [Synergistaceae bacterium]